MPKDKLPPGEAHPNPPRQPHPRIAVPGRDFSTKEVLAGKMPVGGLNKKMAAAKLAQHEQGIGGLAHNLNILRGVAQKHGGIIDFHTEALSLLTILVASEDEAERKGALRYLRQLLPSALPQLQKCQEQEAAMLAAQAKEAEEKLKKPAAPPPEPPSEEEHPPDCGCDQHAKTVAPTS
jgi:hypothetical protein